MKYLRPDDNVWNEFIEELVNLIEDNENVISLKAINFPIDWKEHLHI